MNGLVQFGKGTEFVGNLWKGGICGTEPRGKNALRATFPKGKKRRGEVRERVQSKKAHRKGFARGGVNETGGEYSRKKEQTNPTNKKKQQHKKGVGYMIGIFKQGGERDNH